MNLKLTGKVALVTGAGRGLGRAYALHLAEIGADVVVNDINLESAKEYGELLRADSVKEEITNLGRRSIEIQADVTKKDEVKKMMTKILDEFSHLDILVNNAGGNLNHLGFKAGFPITYPSSMSEVDYRHIMDLNLTSTIFCCQEASIPMKCQKYGKIVNTASITGLSVVPNMVRATSYSVAKAAIIHYTRYLAAELGPYNITVNCIAPGRVYTSRVIGEIHRSKGKALMGGGPSKRHCSPKDVAKVVEFLASDLSDYVTGQCLSIYTSPDRLPTKTISGL